MRPPDIRPDEGFDPLNLDSRVSLNRTVLASCGRPAHELLASYAMRAVIAEELPHLAAGDVIANLDAAIAQGDQGARALATRFGDYLGDLLLSLMTEPGADTFTQTYRRHWAGVRTVYLGGGIAQGALGQLLERRANEVLDGAGVLKPVVVAKYAPLLPLIGAARGVGPRVQTAAVFDFGGSSVKRGVATYDESSGLKTLRVLPPLPSMALPAEADAAQLAAWMADLMAAGVSVLPDGPVQVAASVACYMRDGHPLDYGSGGYQLLRRVTNDASGWLSGAVSGRAGREVTVALSHDGTTAARVFAGEPRTAVVMLGTWIGVGFTPEDASGLRPLAKGFEVV